MQTRIKFDAPSNKTATSRAAAAAVRPRINEQESTVLEFLRDHGPATNDGIAAGTGLPLQSICARVNCLTHKGLIRDAGIAKSANGRNATLREIVR